MKTLAIVAVLFLGILADVALAGEGHLRDTGPESSLSSAPTSMLSTETSRLCILTAVTAEQRANCSSFLSYLSLPLLKPQGSLQECIRSSVIVDCVNRWTPLTPQYPKPVVVLGETREECLLRAPTNRFRCDLLPSRTSLGTRLPESFQSPRVQPLRPISSTAPFANPNPLLKEHRFLGLASGYGIFWAVLWFLGALIGEGRQFVWVTPRVIFGTTLAALALYRWGWVPDVWPAFSCFGDLSCGLPDMWAMMTSAIPVWSLPIAAAASGLVWFRKSSFTGFSAGQISSGAQPLMSMPAMPVSRKTAPSVSQQEAGSTAPAVDGAAPTASATLETPVDNMPDRVVEIGRGNDHRIVEDTAAINSIPPQSGPTLGLEDVRSTQAHSEMGGAKNAAQAIRTAPRPKAAPEDKLTVPFKIIRGIEWMRLVIAAVWVAIIIYAGLPLSKGEVAAGFSHGVVDAMGFDPATFGPEEQGMAIERIFIIALFPALVVFCLRARKFAWIRTILVLDLVLAIQGVRGDGGGLLTTVIALSLVLLSFAQPVKR